jgi:hypothetical protein
MTIRQDEHLAKMRGRAHARYLQSLKALASVRRLDLVAVQINIEKQQVNVGAAGEPTTNDH